MSVMYLRKNDKDFEVIVSKKEFNKIKDLLQGYVATPKGYVIASDNFRIYREHNLFRLNTLLCIELYHDYDILNKIGEISRNDLGFDEDSVLKGILDGYSIFHNHSLDTHEVEVQMHMELTATPHRKRTITRKLDNGQVIEWKAFYDNGWWGVDGVRIPNLISWTKLPSLDNLKCLVLTKVVK